MSLFFIVFVVAELVLLIDSERRYAKLKRLKDSDIREMDLLINDCRVRLEAVEVLSDSVRKLNGVVKDLEQKQPKIEPKNRMNTRAFIAGWDADEPELTQQLISKEELMTQLAKAYLNCQRIEPLPQQCIYPWQSGQLQASAMLPPQQCIYPWQQTPSGAMLPLWYINRRLEDM